MSANITNKYCLPNKKCSLLSANCVMENVQIWEKYIVYDKLTCFKDHEIYD